MNDLNLLALGTTRRCNLACAHCYMDAETRAGAEQLGCEEICTFLDTVASRGKDVMVVLTGGEPLLRNDLETIVRHGTDAGLAMVAGSNGVLLTKKRVRSLKEAGLLGIGISVDSMVPQCHDAFRGIEGCWRKTMAGIEHCREQGLPFQLHFTVTRHNYGELPAIIDFCRTRGSRVLNVFFLICTGRGASLSDLSPRLYEQALTRLISAQAENPDLIIRPRCAPYYKRIAHQLNPGALVNLLGGREGDGCIAGISYCHVGAGGGITPCPFIEETAGSIRNGDFWDVWDKSSVFEALRRPRLRGKCGACEYQLLCGGCRARPLTQGKGLMDEDEWCDYQPENARVIVPLDEPPQALVWSDAADRRIQRVPGFIRRMVKKKVEAYVQGKGERVITGRHLDEMTAQRFGGHPPHRPGRPDSG